METDTQIILDSKPFQSNRIKKSRIKNFRIVLCFTIIVIFVINIIGIILLFISQNKTKIETINLLNENINKIRNELFQKISNLKETIEKQEEKIKSQEYNFKEINEKYIKIFNRISINNQINKEFNQDINDKYIEEQNYFCDNQNIFNNSEYENQIRTAKVDFNNKTYDMYVFNNYDAVSTQIINIKSWEGFDTNKILEILSFYSNKTQIKNEDLFILDIGANLGWYSFILGKFGYKIISFEPSERNYYILRKSYCLNKDVNITIINKGLYTDEKTCDYYEHVGNKGNGMVICEKRNDIPYFLEKKSVIYLTKLSNYIPYLSNKNIVFMKIDVEGSEEAAILGGIELITKYHVPFIFLEYCPNNLKLHDVNKKNFLEIFDKNGYKISRTSFLDKNYLSIDYLAGQDNLINLYIVYEKIFE